MDPRLLDYYNRELLYIREMGGEFAKEFPKIAGRLGLDSFECADPYVERLLEGFAFMAARVHLKLESEFPKFTDHLMEMIYPHYLAPTPSMAVVQFEPDLQEGSLLKGFTLPRGTSIHSLMGPGDQTKCQYRTSQDVTLWPLTIKHASYSSRDVVASRLPSRFQDAKSILHLRLAVPKVNTFRELPIDRLPIFLRGRDSRSMLLYEQLFADVSSMIVMWEGQTSPVVLDNAVGPMGFEDDQALLPTGPQSFKGYRLLNEYFAFYQRFMFVEFIGLQKAFSRCPTNEVDLILPLRRSHARLENIVDLENFALNCSPAINLFPHMADRIHLNESEVEYHIVPDRTRPMDYEVYSVQGVQGFDASSEAGQSFRPFYAIEDADLAGSTRETGYYSTRRAPRQLSAKQRRKGPRSSYIGSEVYLSIVDPANAPYSPSLSQLNLKLLCTNRDLPLSMPVGKLNTDFTLETGAPVKSIRCLAGPTEPTPSFATLPGDRSWRLISHLALNYLSIIDSDNNGAATLREMLMLYEDVYATGNTRETEGVVSVASRSIIHRLSRRGPLAFGRGVEITLTCDESKFDGASAFLLASVLSDFFSKYVSINSFTQTVLRTLDRGEVMRWPINVGRRQIL
ncbi:MAG: type VI secretion system baseplate subunit TssF [Pirellulaceae bacterium]|nr:type VI secretion system baseplate subunit TssF [Pirellulaceae bacterium]